MKIAFNPSTVAALTSPPDNKDITFDLSGHNIFARGVKFQGTDTNTWRDIKVNNVSIGSNVLDLRNGSNTTLTNTDGVVTINSTWRPVVDNLTSNSTTSSLSANQGRVLAGLINTLGTNISNQYALRNGSNATGRWQGGLACIDIRDTNYTPHDLNQGLELHFQKNGTNNLKDGGVYNGVFSFRQWSSSSDWSGGKAHQLSFTDNGNIWHRTSSGDDSWEAWKKLAYSTDIPTSLKNPHALTISLNGTSQGPYDGSAAKNINITPSSIGAATSGHNHDDRYLKLTGGTMLLGEGLKFHSNNNYFGTDADARIISLLDSNDKICDGGLIIDERATLDGKEYVTELLRIRDFEFKWRGADILHSGNYSGILDARYYTESEVNSLLDAKLNRQNLSYGNWNPRGYNLAADYHYNGGDLSISENSNKIFVSIDGSFWQNEGQYRVLDTSDVASLKGDLTVHQYLSATDATWWPLIWGGSAHANTSDSTGTVYKSHDKLSWQTSSQTLYATNIQTNNIKNLSIGGGIYWNPYVESATDNTDAASITLVRAGVAGGTTLVLSQMNDANDTIQFKTNTAAKLYHNSYPILTTQNTYVSNNKGYIYGTEITQVNNSDTVDGVHASHLLVKRGRLGAYNIDHETTFGTRDIQPESEVTISGKRPFNGWGTLLVIGSIDGASNQQLAFTGDNRMFIRCAYGTSNNYNTKDWATVALTSDNVASATKLQTPRTIWGQSFDGTRDIPISVPAKMPFVFFKRYDNNESAGYIGCGSSSNNNIYIESYINSNIILGSSSTNNVGIGTNSPAYKLHVNGTFRATNSTVSDLFVNTGDATLKIYTGITADAQNDGNICFQTSIDATDGQSHAYPTEFQNRCNIVLQPRGGQVYIGTNPGIGNTTYKLYVNSKIFSNGGFVKNGSSDSYVLLGGGGHKALSDLGSSHTHTVFKNNLMIKGTNGISDSASIHLGIGDSDTGFKWISDGVCQMYANNVAIGQWTSGGMDWFKNPTVNGNKVWNAGNDGSGSGLDADTLDGEHASSFVRAGHYESGDLNSLDPYSFIKSVNSNVAGTSPNGNTGWYNVIQLVHRNGASDGPSYIGQIALGMTTNTNDMFFRGKRTDPWKTVIHSGNIGSQTVNTAQYLRSLGNQNCQTGRTQNYGDVYTYNTITGNTGSPTTYTSVIGFGRGIGGTVEIAGGWRNTNLYWRSLRDCCEDWFSWRTVLDSDNYTEFIGNYYWANVKISTSSSTTTSPTVHTLTATRVCAGHNPGIDNSISCSNWFRSSGNTGWYNTTYRGGWYMSDTSWIRAHNGVGIYTSGQIMASGFHHQTMNSDNYMLLAGGGYKSFGGDDNNPIFLGYLNLDHGNDGTISSSFSCLGYSVPFTYTRGGNYCRINIPDTTHQVFYIKAAIASVNYSGGGMDTWVGVHRGNGAWWLHCYASGANEVRVKGFCQNNNNNDSWWGGNPLGADNGTANKITVCIFGYVKFR